MEGRSHLLVGLTAGVVLDSLVHLTGDPLTMAKVVPKPIKYLFIVTRSAVLPSPRTSYVTPIFGVMSFQLTCCVSGNVMLRLGTSGPGPSVLAG